MKLRRLYKNELTTLFTQERSHEEFFEPKQIDIKLVAGVGFEPTTFGL